MNSTLTITTPAEVTALTTLERVKQELSVPAGDDVDELLTAKIDEASSDIAVRSGPSLKRETVTETFWRSAPCGSWSAVRVDAPLILRRYPVASIASVTLDDVLIDAAEYRFGDDSGLLYRLDPSGFPIWWQFSKSAIIVYDAGYLLPGQANRDLPASLEAAAIELVTSYWSARGRDPMLKSEENVGVSRFDYWVGAVGAAGDLPPGVMSKIAPYVKVNVG